MVSSVADAARLDSAGSQPASTPSPTSPAIYYDWKVVQRPGAFAYPVRHNDRVVNRLALFTIDKNKRYARTVNSMVADGISIPIIPEHDNKGVPLTQKEMEKKILTESVGFIRGARVNAAGELELLHEVSDPLWVPRMGTMVKDCSPGFRDWYRTGDGKKWTDVVAHVALTHHPVDHHKPKFAPVPVHPPLEKPKAGGICVLARDTGRVLMLQRAISGGDPASGTWEFPGGHIEEGETPLQGAKREWAEETGLKLPRNAERTGGWKSANGVYEGFVLTIPVEENLDINLYHEDRKVRNPDDPDGDCVETLAWWQPSQLMGNPALRKELQLDLGRVVQATAMGSGNGSSSSFSTTYMSLTPVSGPDTPQLVPIWEVPFSAALACLHPAGTSHVFHHADGKQRFGSRSKAINWLRTQYSRKFSVSSSQDAENGTIWMAVMRAPIGGVSLQGKFYPGGQFIPNEVLEKATPEEKQKIQAAKEGHVAKRGADAKANMKDAETVHDAILRHAGAHGMDEQHPLDKRDTLRRWSALKAEHGDQGALERVVTLAAKEAKGLQEMGEDGKHSAMGKHYQRRLAAYAQMVGFAVNPDSVGEYKKGLKEALSGEGGKRSMVEAGSDSSQDKVVAEPQQEASSDGNKKITETESVTTHEPTAPTTHPDAHKIIADSQHLSPIKKQQFGDAIKLVESKLPQTAKDRLAKHLKGFAFHSDVDDLTAALIERSPDMKEKLGGKKAGGVYSKKTGELHLNGGERIDGKKVTPDAVYAHEYSHAIDGPEHELSKTAEWKDAWKAEAQMVSRYATKTPQEGFAEFGRMVYSSGLGEDQLRERYPKMMGEWERLGLLPDAMGKGGDTQLASGNAPQMPDVFSEPFNTDDAIGDKPLARRASHEGLKDYLRGIGGEPAHDTIRDYSKQLHEQAKGETDQHNAGVRYANDLLEQYGGKKFNRNHPAFKTGDLAQLPRFDEIVSAVDSEHPGLLSGGDTGDKGQHLYERLKEGIRPTPDARDFEDKAVQEWHENGRPMPEGYEPTSDAGGGESGDADTSFDFGANVEKSDGGKQAIAGDATDTEPHPFKPTSEDHKESWAKFAAKAKAGGGSGLILPEDGDFSKQPAQEAEKKYEERDTEAMLREKMASEGKRAAKPDAATPARKPKYNTETGELLPTEDGEKPASSTLMDKYRSDNPDQHQYANKIADPILKQVDKGGWHKAEDVGSVHSIKGNNGLYEPTRSASNLLTEMADKGHVIRAWDKEGNPYYAKAGEKYPSHLMDEKQVAEMEGKATAPIPTPSPTEIATGDFMKPPAPPAPGRTTYTADDIEELAGQSFTNDKGLTVDVVKDEDGTWSVGKKYGLSAQGAANHLNDLGAEPAQGLFGKEVTAQDVAVGKPKEKLEWAPPAKPKGDDAKGQGELPGMKDAYAPGMFGRAKTESEATGSEKPTPPPDGEEGGAKTDTPPPDKSAMDVAINALRPPEPPEQTTTTETPAALPKKPVRIKGLEKTSRIAKAFFGQRAKGYDFKVSVEDFDVRDAAAPGRFKGVDVPPDLAAKWDAGIRECQRLGLETRSLEGLTVRMKAMGFEDYEARAKVLKEQMRADKEKNTNTRKTEEEKRKGGPLPSWLDN